MKIGWDYWASNDPKIGYVRITQFTSDTFASLKKVMDKLLADHMQGLILDLRFDPGGRLDQAKEVVNLFVRNGVIVKVKGRNRPEEITRAKAEDARAGFPDGGAGQRALGQRKRNRGRQSEGQPPRPDRRHAHLWQGLGSGTDPAGREQRRVKADGGVLLSAERSAGASQEGFDRLGRRSAITLCAMDGEQEKKLIQDQLATDVMHGPIHAPDDPSRLDATRDRSPIDGGLDALVQEIRSGRSRSGSRSAGVPTFHTESVNSLTLSDPVQSYLE